MISTETISAIITTGMMIGFLLELLSIFYLLMANRESCSQEGKKYLKKALFFSFVGISLQFVEEIYSSYVVLSPGEIFFTNPMVYLLYAFAITFAIILIVEKEKCFFFKRV